MSKKTVYSVVMPEDSALEMRAILEAFVLDAYISVLTPKESYCYSVLEITINEEFEDGDYR